jgi:hypothetical protein
VWIGAGAPAASIKKDDHGRLRIVVHHPSLPHAPR